MNKLLHTLAAALLAAGSAWPAAWAQTAATTTVNRCEAQGRVVFQQAPCPPGQQASQVAVPSRETNVTEAPPARSASAPAPQASSAPTGPTPPGPSQPPEQEACLAYLKPLLHDPASGRILSAVRDGRVLQVKLHAADRRGRPQVRDAACGARARGIDRGRTFKVRGTAASGAHG